MLPCKISTCPAGASQTCLTIFFIFHSSCLPSTCFYQAYGEWREIKVACATNFGLVTFYPFWYDIIPGEPGFHLKKIGCPCQFLAG
jgi:hypothetical protein